MRTLAGIKISAFLFSLLISPALLATDVQSADYLKLIKLEAQWVKLGEVDRAICDVTLKAIWQELTDGIVTDERRDLRNQALAKKMLSKYVARVNADKKITKYLAEYHRVESEKQDFYGMLQMVEKKISNQPEYSTPTMYVCPNGSTFTNLKQLLISDIENGCSQDKEADMPVDILSVGISNKISKSEEDNSHALIYVHVESDRMLAKFRGRQVILDEVVSFYSYDLKNKRYEWEGAHFTNGVSHVNGLFGGQFVRDYMPSFCLSP